MKKEKIVLANAFAFTVTILWVVCSLIVAVFPAFSLTVTSWWMHGEAPSAMGTWNLTWGNVFLGGVTLAVAAWLSAYLFGWCWEIVSGKQIALHSEERVSDA